MSNPSASGSTDHEEAMEVETLGNEDIGRGSAGEAGADENNASARSTHAVKIIHLDTTSPEGIHGQVREAWGENTQQQNTTESSVLDFENQNQFTKDGAVQIKVSEIQKENDEMQRKLGHTQKELDSSKKEIEQLKEELTKARQDTGYPSSQTIDRQEKTEEKEKVQIQPEASGMVTQDYQNRLQEMYLENEASKETVVRLQYELKDERSKTSDLERQLGMLQSRYSHETKSPSTGVGTGMKENVEDIGSPVDAQTQRDELKDTGTRKKENVGNFGSSVDPQDYHNSLQETLRVNDGLNETVMKLQNALEVERLKTSELEGQIGIKEDVNQALNNKQQELQRKLAENDYVLQEKAAFIGQNNKLHRELSEMTQKFNHFQQENMRYKSWMEGAQKTISQLNQNLQYLDAQCQQKEHDIQNMNERFRVVDTERREAVDAKQKLLLRLSEMAGAKLTQGNPHIADLSDQNRPTKLGEKYSELYDNEWTDAFEELVDNLNKEEEDAIKDMLTMTMGIFEVCLEIAGGYEKNVFSSVTRLTVCDERERESRKESGNALTDAQTQTDADTDQSDPVAMGLGRESPEAPMATVNESSITSDRGASAWGSVPGGAASADAQVETDVELPVEMAKQLKDIRKYMAVQLSKVVQKECLRRIQPALGHPLENLEKNRFYVMKCAELCWLMCIQDPPLSLIGDAEIGSPFDENLYRHYTRSGNTVEYVVWPALALQKDGALLCKGVAQGEKKN